MRILAIEGALARCSAAVLADGEIVASAREDAARGHPSLLPSMAQAVLELCSRPPGELSGRRVLSLDLLRELGATIRTLDGRGPLAGFSL